MDGTPARLNEDEYVRHTPGRTAKKKMKLLNGSRIMVLDSCVSEYNEVWYRIAVQLYNVIYFGYLQASAVDLGLAAVPPPQTTNLVKTGVSYDLHHEFDRDGDGTYVVVLNPGHGGPYKGAVRFGTEEKGLNLKVALVCKEYLETHYENVTVYMTRSTDEVFDNISEIDDIEYAVRYGEEKGADIFVSIHFDTGNTITRGAEGIISRNGDVTPYSKCLASFILRELEGLGIENLGTMTRRSGRSRYSYPDGPYMDGYLVNRLCTEKGIVNCIIEHAHFDNAEDYKNFVAKEGMLQKIGEADARGIAEYLGLKEKQ
jgi:N-acetylmuramoyl-L-alanine amidase